MALHGDPAIRGFERARVGGPLNFEKFVIINVETHSIFPSPLKLVMPVKTGISGDSAYRPETSAFAGVTGFIWSVFFVVFNF